MSIDRKTKVIQSLCKTGVHVGIPRLLKGMHSDNEKHRKVAKQALVDFTGLDLGDDVEDWEDWWLENKSNYTPAGTPKPEAEAKKPEPAPAPAPPPAPEPAPAPAPAPPPQFEGPGPDETQAIGPIPEDISTTDKPLEEVFPQAAQDMPQADPLGFMMGHTPAPDTQQEPEVPSESQKMRQLMDEWDSVAQEEPAYEQAVEHDTDAVEVDEAIGGVVAEELSALNVDLDDDDTKQYSRSEAEVVTDEPQDAHAALDALPSDDQETLYEPREDQHPTQPVPPPQFQPQPQQPQYQQPYQQPYPAQPQQPPPPGATPPPSSIVLTDTEEQKVKEAVEWLEILGPREAVPQLIEHVDHPNHYKQKRVLAILERLTNKNFGTNRRAWQDWFDSRQYMTFKQIRAE